MEATSITVRVGDELVRHDVYVDRETGLDVDLQTGEFRSREETEAMVREVYTVGKEALGSDLDRYNRWLRGGGAKKEKAMFGGGDVVGKKVRRPLLHNARQIQSSSRVEEIDDDDEDERSRDRDRVSNEAARAIKTAVEGQPSSARGGEPASRGSRTAVAFSAADAERRRVQGNDAMTRGNVHAAVEHYTAGLLACLDAAGGHPQSSSAWESAAIGRREDRGIASLLRRADHSCASSHDDDLFLLVATLLSNRAEANLKLSRAEAALSDAHRALRFPPLSAGRLAITIASRLKTAALPPPSLREKTAARVVRALIALQRRVEAERLVQQCIQEFGHSPDWGARARDAAAIPALILTRLAADAIPGTCPHVPVAVQCNLHTSPWREIASLIDESSHCSSDPPLRSPAVVEANQPPTANLDPVLAFVSGEIDDLRAATTQVLNRRTFVGGAATVTATTEHRDDDDAGTRRCRSIDQALASLRPLPQLLRVMADHSGPAAVTRGKGIVDAIKSHASLIEPVVDLTREGDAARLDALWAASIAVAQWFEERQGMAREATSHAAGGAVDRSAAATTSTSRLAALIGIPLAADTVTTTTTPAQCSGSALLTTVATGPPSSTFVSDAATNNDDATAVAIMPKIEWFTFVCQVAALVPPPGEAITAELRQSHGGGSTGVEFWLLQHRFFFPYAIWRPYLELTSDNHPPDEATSSAAPQRQQDEVERAGASNRRAASRGEAALVRVTVRATIGGLDASFDDRNDPSLVDDAGLIDGDVSSSLASGSWRGRQLGVEVSLASSQAAQPGGGNDAPRCRRFAVLSTSFPDRHPWNVW